jgi:hypothetical protein
MCRPVSRQSRFSSIFFLQQEPEPEPEPEPRARIQFRFFLGQNDTVPAVPVLQHCVIYYFFQTTKDNIGTFEVFLVQYSLLSILSLVSDEGAPALKDILGF